MNFLIQPNADGRKENLIVLFRHSGMPLAGIHSVERISGFRPEPCRNAGKVGFHTEHAQIFLFFLTENLAIRHYAFSETAPGKSGPFGGVETSNSPCA